MRAFCLPLSTRGLREPSAGYGVRDLRRANLSLAPLPRFSRPVLTLRPEEPKGRAGGVSHSGDSPEAVVGSRDEHRAADHAEFRN